MSSSDKLFGRKTNVVEDQLKAVGVADKFDPIYDSESEGEDCFYSVLDVAPVDEFRENLNRQTSYSVLPNKNTNGLPPSPADTANKGNQPTGRLTYEEYSTKIAAMLREYEATNGKNELCESLMELNYPICHDYFVVKAIRWSMDKSTESQLDMSGVITVMHTRRILTTQHITRAMEKLIQSVEDLKLDVLDAGERLLTFIECAVEDGCIENDFTERLPERYLASLQTDTWTNRTDRILRLHRIRDDMRKYKTAVREFEKDFFNSRDLDEIRQFLTELSRPSLRHEFVRLLVEASLEKTDQHREMVSNMLDKFYGKLLKPHDTQLGFARLIGVVDDLELDAPNAADLLAKYLARSIVDEILPPSFLVDNYRLHLGGTMGMSILKKAQKWLAQSSGKARTVLFRKIWTGTDPTTKEAREFKHDIKQTLSEYFDSFDKAEAARLIGNMDLTPDQCGETVRKIIVFGMERGTKGGFVEAALNLLKHLVDCKEFDGEVIGSGINQTHEMMEEIQLDVPDASEQLDKYIEEAKTRQLLPAEYRRPFNDST